MRRLMVRAGLATFALLVAAGWTYLKATSSGADMTKSAHAYLSSLSEEQKAISLLPYGSPARVGWHFIPKDERKGLQIKHMEPKQRKAALALLRSALSQAGYQKARKIMALERVLADLESGRQGGNIRDHQRYYFTVFGEPGDAGRWGLSVEGHHLSLNFVVEDGQVLSSTPTFFAANPTIVQQDVEGAPARGTRVLAQEEVLAFELIQSLQEGQRADAIIADKAPREIRAAGEAQSPAYEKTGLCFATMNGKQQTLVRKLIAEYANNLPDDVAQARLAAIEQSGYDATYFAWAGPDQPGIGHYYLIQGPTFLIEFVNTQPDAAGNPASHIHCVWRDPSGDFALPVSRS